MDQGTDILTPAEAARYLRVHRETLYDLIRDRTIKASKVGGRWRIQKTSLDVYLQRDYSPSSASPVEDGDLLQKISGARPSRPYQYGDDPKHKRILVVDDSPQVREFFEVALTRRGHAVLSVSSGYEAVEQVKKDVYDLVFIDLLMPQLDGVDTLKAIREIDPDPMVVLITGYPEGELVTKALGLGPFVLLDKPIRVADLLKVVEG